MKKQILSAFLLLLATSLACKAVPGFAAPSPQPSPTHQPTLKPSATRTPTFTPTKTPTPTPAVTEGPIAEFDFGEMAALDYPRANWQYVAGALVHRSLPGCSLRQGNAGEADSSNRIQIGAFTWMISYNGAYTLMSAGEAHLTMELGKKPTTCKQAITTLMRTVHTASEYAQAGECRYAPAQRLKVGDTATVLSSSYLRTEPRWDEKTRIRLVSPTEKLTIKITGGPVCAIYNKGEYSYWQVDLSNGKTGWMAEGDLQEYYLIPRK